MTLNYLLNDDDITKILGRKVKAANHERRSCIEGRSVYMVPDNEPIPGRDDLGNFNVTGETSGDLDDEAAIYAFKRSLREGDAK